MANKRPILIVDDDEAILDLIQITLELEGYEVATARDGREALGFLGTVAPALILLDMRMPGMNGWEFAQAYRAAANGQAPVVVMTAGAEASKVAAEVRAEGYLAKPFDVEDLLAAVRGHV